MDNNALNKLAKEYLAKENRHITYRGEDLAVKNLFAFLLEGNAFSGNYRDRIDEILAKNIGELSVDEIKIHLTGLAKADRINDGLFVNSVNNGTVARLLRRLLELQNSGE